MTLFQATFAPSTAQINNDNVFENLNRVKKPIIFIISTQNITKRIVLPTFGMLKNTYIERKQSTVLFTTTNINSFT